MHLALREAACSDMEHCAKIIYGKHMSRLGRVSDFGIKKIKDGSGTNIVVINGFLNQNETDTQEWESALRRIWPQNPWYYLSWESKRVGDVWNKADLNLWGTAMEKAEKSGYYLAKTLLMHNDKYILCGHSLGARVIYYALKHLSGYDKRVVEEAHLLGGAVGSGSAEWRMASKAVEKRVVNYRSLNDDVLKYLYSLGTFFDDDPVGRHKIVCREVENIDMTRSVNGHSSYKKYFAMHYQNIDQTESGSGFKVKINFGRKR